MYVCGEGVVCVSMGVGWIECVREVVWSVEVTTSVWCTMFKFVGTPSWRFSGFLRSQYFKNLIQYFFLILIVNIIMKILSYNFSLSSARLLSQACVLNLMKNMMVM